MCEQLGVILHWQCWRGLASHSPSWLVSGAWLLLCWRLDVVEVSSEVRERMALQYSFHAFWWGFGWCGQQKDGYSIGDGFERQRLLIFLPLTVAMSLRVATYRCRRHLLISLSCQGCMLFDWLVMMDSMILASFSRSSGI